MEDERIAHLKQRNEERLARFLDSKNRCIGIDQGAIQGQIDEKQRRAAAERVAESKYGASAGGLARARGGSLSVLWCLCTPCTCVPVATTPIALLRVGGCAVCVWVFQPSSTMEPFFGDAHL